MLSLKAASSKETVSAWEITRKCHLSAFVFFALSYCATCEPSSLLSSRNSSTIFSPLQSVFLTSTPNLAGVAYGQAVLSPPEQTNLESAINSVNDGFISQFGAYTGNHEPVTIRTTQGFSSSSLKTNAPIMEATPTSHTVWQPLQSENRNARESMRGGAVTQNLQTLQFTSRETSTMGTISNTVVKSSYMQYNTNSRMASEITSALGNVEISLTQTASPYSDISSTMSLPVVIAHTALLQSSFKLSRSARLSLTSEHERAQSISSSHEKFTDSVSRMTLNLHVASNMFSSDDLSPGIARSKSTFLSHYSTGTARQVQIISSSLSSNVLQTPRLTSSSAVPRDSTSSAATTVQHDSSSFSITAVITKDSSSSIITSMPGDSSSFTSPTSFTSTTFESYFKSASLKERIYTARTPTTSSFATATLFTSVQPSLPSSVIVQEKRSLTCEVNYITCVCFNCNQARNKTCCQDLIDRANIQQGVTMTMADITVETFYQKMTNVSHVIAEVILDSCKSNSTRCLSNEKSSETTGVRKKRSPQTDLLKDFSSSKSVKTKMESDSVVFISQTLSSSVNKEALPNISPSKSNISHFDVIIYSISSNSGRPKSVETTFFVTATSNINGTNRTQLLDGKGLIQILRDKKHTLENRLNITIDSFSDSQPSKVSQPTSLTFNTTPVPNSSPGRENQQTSLSTPQGRNFVIQ